MNSGGLIKYNITLNTELLIWRCSPEIFSIWKLLKLIWDILEERVLFVQVWLASIFIILWGKKLTKNSYLPELWRRTMKANQYLMSWVIFFTEKSIPITNIISVETDGTSAMVGRYRWFIGHLKKIRTRLTAFHCVIYRQHFVAKNLSDQSPNFVRNNRSNALNTHLFAQFCDENDEFQWLLSHAEVRWLSKGTCLTRFYSVFDSLLEFLESRNPNLREHLIQFITDIAYLTDLFEKSNDDNLQF